MLLMVCSYTYQKVVVAFLSGGTCLLIGGGGEEEEDPLLLFVTSFHERIKIKVVQTKRERTEDGGKRLLLMGEVAPTHVTR